MRKQNNEKDDWFDKKSLFYAPKLEINLIQL
jgi:hypothetical protein